MMAYRPYFRQGDTYRTKLSIEAELSQNHYRWYKLLFPALFDQSESRPSQYDSILALRIDSHRLPMAPR